jgi:hypothetical protein
VKNGISRASHFLAAGQELTGIERICKLLLEAFRRRASDEGVGTLLEVDD